MDKRIFLSTPHMGGYEMEYIKEAFDTNWVAPLGANVNMFEEAVCDYTGRAQALAVSSGTAAMHLVLKYFGVGKGDIVFCQSFTFSGSCNPVAYEGARLVFIDSERDSWNMCPKALKRAYKKYPSPKVLLIVNLYGRPAKYDELLEIAARHGTLVLEDAAESLGSVYKGVQTGNFGDMSILSFNGNKIITTSGGGMVLADSLEAKRKMLFWATQSREPYAWYEHKEIGYNYRLSNICAGIGRGQMKVLNERIAQKRRINALYAEAFKGHRYISILQDAADCVSNCWLTTALIDSGSRLKPLGIIEALAQHNVEARPAWKPMHLQPVFAGSDYITAEDGVDVCGELFRQGICLPSDTKMTEDELNYVVGLIKELL